jgi:hypothetical protein
MCPQLASDGMLVLFLIQLFAAFKICNFISHKLNRTFKQVTDLHGKLRSTNLSHFEFFDKLHGESQETIGYKEQYQDAHWINNAEESRQGPVGGRVDGLLAS